MIEALSSIHYKYSMTCKRYDNSISQSVCKSNNQFVDRSNSINHACNQSINQQKQPWMFLLIFFGWGWGGGGVMFFFFRRWTGCEDIIRRVKWNRWHVGKPPESHVLIKILSKQWRQYYKCCFYFSFKTLLIYSNTITIHVVHTKISETNHILIIMPSYKNDRTETSVTIYLIAVTILVCGNFNAVNIWILFWYPTVQSRFIGSFRKRSELIPSSTGKARKVAIANSKELNKCM